MIARSKLHAACLGAALFFAVPLGAAERPPSTPPLPGVDGRYRIVKPAPVGEPDNSTPANSANSGRWDVRISGTITLDVGVGKLPLPRK